MHFKIDKANSDTGFIQTHALRGAQWFELWRRDNAGPQALAEANLHSLRRTVTVHIREENGRTLIHCHVLSERLSVPSRPITSSSQLYRLLTNSENMMQRLEFSEQQERSMEWIDIGGESGLEKRILARIERGLPAASKKTPAA
jgi:hypothetical protein